MPSFSERQGFTNPPKEIRFREELPIELRQPVLDIVKRYCSDSLLREVVTDLFDPYGIEPPKEFRQPIQSIYGESAVALDVRRFFLYCSWNTLYDIIEEFVDRLIFHEQELAEPGERARVKPLQKELNDYFVYAGVGWQLVGRRIIVRSDESFQQSVPASIAKLKEGGRPTTANRIRSALKALSERPDADTSGAVSHATSAVESLLHDITGEALTLGEYLKKHANLFHPALKKGLEGVYGFACDAGARHGKEGTAPSFNEAQFAVTTCAATCTLLGVTNPKRSS